MRDDAIHGRDVFAFMAAARGLRERADFAKSRWMTLTRMFGLTPATAGRR
jgi:hypothetical protein